MSNALTPLKIRGMQQDIIRYALEMREGFERFEERQRSATATFENPDPKKRTRFDPKTCIEDLLPVIQSSVFRVLMAAAFSSDVSLPEGLADNMQVAFGRLSARSFSAFPYWHLFQTSDDKAAQKFFDSFRNFAKTILLEGRNSGMMESLIASNESNSLSEDQIIGNISHVIIAGFETTSTTFFWLLFYLSKYPALQERLHKEVDATLGSGPDLDQISDPVRKFPFAASLVKETLRYMPVAPIAGLQTLEDCSINDIQFKKGTDILLLTRLASFEATPTKDPYSFNPDRWNPDLVDEATLVKQAQLLLGFGGGPRVCPGRGLAIHELIWFTVLVAGAFRVKELDLPSGHYPVQSAMRFTVGPKNLYLRLISRARQV